MTGSSIAADRLASVDKRESGHGALGRAQEDRRHQPLVDCSACGAAPADDAGHREHRCRPQQDISGETKGIADTARMGHQCGRGADDRSESWSRK